MASLTINVGMMIIEVCSKRARHQRRLFLISSEKEDYHHGRNEPPGKGKRNFLPVFFVLIASGRVNEIARYYGYIETNLFSFHFHWAIGNVYTRQM